MKKTLINAARALAVLLGIGVGWAVKSDAAQFVELTAEFQTLSWRYSGSNCPPSVKPRTWTTRCVVGTNSWLIEGDFFPAKQAWWFTGSNVTAHTVMTAHPSERREMFERNHPRLVIGKGFTTVFESSDGKPVGPALPAGMQLLESATLNLPWLAFCSGSYLRDEHRRVPLPGTEFWSYRGGYTQEVARYRDELGLTSGADFYTNEGQPVLRYRVLESTNVLGWSFPLRFELAQYRQDWRSWAWELELTASGRVVSIGPGSPPGIPTAGQKAVEKAATD